MDKYKLFLIILFCMMTNVVSAYDFAAENDDGVTIYYNIIDDFDYGVQVTYSSYHSPSYTGDIKIPDGIEYSGVTYYVTSIGDRAFYNCSGLTSIEIPYSLMWIESNAFDGCSSLKSIEIPNSVTSIGDYAFYGCSSLTSIVIPNSVTSIGSGTFENCSSLKSIVIPNSVTSIGGFSGCSSLTSIVIPNSVTSIGSGMFEYCSSLKSIEIPNSVTSIGDYAFNGCSSLTSIVIPNSVTSIGSGTFDYCPSLTSIVVASDNPVYDSRDNCNAIIEKSSNTLIVGCQNTVIPNSVTSIGFVAFCGCCFDLTSIEIPNSVTTIGQGAFGDCFSLTNIEIPNSVTSIGDYAFNGCSSLTSIEIPNSVTSIGDGAFSGTAWYNNQPDGLVYVGMVAYKYKGTMPSGTTITLQDGTVSIAGSAFDGCSGLTSIEIPNSVTSIGRNAFSGTAWYNNQPDGLVYAGKVAYKYKGTMPSGTTITLQDGTVGIAGSAFNGCSSLTSIEIPNSVTTIGQGAFNGCSSLTSIKIPNSVTCIGEYAFYNCFGLTELHWTPNANTNLSSSITYARLTSIKRTLYLYKNAENSDMVNALVTTLDGQFKEIIVVEDYGSFDLTVSDAGMSTLYLDYPVAVPDDDNLIAVFYVNKIEDHIMWLKKVKNDIPANTGVIVQANPVTITFSATTHNVAAITDNQLTGVTERTPVSSIDGTVYTLGRGRNSGYLGFFKYTGANLPANKAFMVRNTSSGVNGFKLVLDNEDGTSTAIGRVNEDGEFVPESSVIYDLQGRRVEHPSKGIYIVNGKKKYIK